MLQSTMVYSDFLIKENVFSREQSSSQYNRELKQTDAAAANLQISIQKDSRSSEFSRPLTSITLNLNGDLPVDRPGVSLLKLPNKRSIQKSLTFLTIFE